MSFLASLKFLFAAPVSSASSTANDLVHLLRLLTAVYVPTLVLLLWQTRRMKRQLAESDGSEAKKKKQDDLSNKIMEDLRVQLVDERKKRLALEKDFSDEKSKLEKTLQAKLEEYAALSGKYETSLSTLNELRSQIAKLEADVRKLTEAVTRETDRANEALIDVTSEKTKAEKLDKELHKERDKSKKLELQCDRAQKEIEDLNTAAADAAKAHQKQIEELTQQHQQKLQATQQTSSSSSRDVALGSAPSSLQARSPPSTAVLDLLSDLERSLAQVDGEFDANPTGPTSTTPGDSESALRQSAETLAEIERALEEADRDDADLNNDAHSGSNASAGVGGGDVDDEDEPDNEDEDDEEDREDGDEPQQDPFANEPVTKPAPVPLPDASSSRSILAGGTRAGPKRRVSFVDADAVAAAMQSEQEEEEGEGPAAASEGFLLASDASPDNAPLVRGVAVREDANLSSSAGKSAGMSASRKRIGGHGSGPEQMEDQHLVLWPVGADQDMALFCVFDGHGGKEAAIDAKELFPIEWTKRLLLPENRNSVDLSVTFREAYASVDQQMIRHEYMGCTATTVFVWRPRGSAQRFLQCANVGDSSAYLIRNGEAVMLSFDHKVSDKREKERIRAMGIEIHETQGRVGGLAVSRALGDHYPKSEKCGLIGEPHCSEPIPLQSTDSWLILASDGLWDCMDGKTAYETIKDHQPDVNQMATVLIGTALKNSKWYFETLMLIIHDLRPQLLMEQLQLHNRVAIITGSASGIGRAAALLFAKNGAKIAVVDLNEPEGNNTVNMIKTHGGDAEFFKTDVGNSQSVQELVKGVMSHWGRIDILYNNAAPTVLCNEKDRAVHELPEEVWDKMINVALKGVFLCSKYTIPHMMAQKKGVVLNTATVDAILGSPGIDSYTAAKGGVIALTRSMATNYAKHGIRVNCVSPGWVITECQTAWFSNPDSHKAIAATHLTRVGKAEDVAEMALFLVSDKAEFITGANLVVDGGYTATKIANMSSEVWRTDP